MADAEQLRRALWRQPFHSFMLVMADGTVYSVPGPEWLSVPPVITRPKRVAYYVMPDSGTVGDVENYELRWLDLHQITDVIETRVSVAETEGNGE
jgi:hypothetical protein